MSHKTLRPAAMVSVVVVTWNNLESLRQCLGAMDNAAVYSGLKTEIIVVNNGSSDGTKEFLNNNPLIRNFSFDRNTGFGPASNQGIRMARSPLIVLLNDDIVVSPDFLGPMARHFAMPEVFAVAPLMILNGKPLPGRSVGCFRRGLLEIEVRNDHPGKPAYTLFAGGGAGMFRREMLLALGGFDEMYHPFYYEDLDLGYRAWKRGWRCISEPGSVVHHHHAGTIGKRFSRRYVYAISRRNYLLFHWKNIHDPRWLAEHGGSLMKNVFRALITFKLVEIWVLVLALTRACQAMRARTTEVSKSVLDDRSVLGKISQNNISA
ncbi:MAG: glycosyltransferase family 2 protein [Deltaproteobacteria bacterium]|nr:glycosyltransferase family 2 protein [Deltaproteobacteria bacterium]